MTVGEKMKIGENIGKDYIDEIAQRMVKSMIEARMNQIRTRLADEFFKHSHKDMKKALAILEKAEEMEFYQVLINNTRNRLVACFRKEADNTALDLTNAEYYGFTGRLR